MGDDGIMVPLRLSFSQLAVNRLPGMAASFVLRVAARSTMARLRRRKGGASPDECALQESTPLYPKLRRRHAAETGSPSDVGYFNSSALKSRLSFKHAWRRTRK
jgi:hypothetical protein